MQESSHPLLPAKELWALTQRHVCNLHMNLPFCLVLCSGMYQLYDLDTLPMKTSTGPSVSHKFTISTIPISPTHLVSLQTNSNSTPSLRRNWKASSALILNKRKLIKQSKGNHGFSFSDLVINNFHLPKYHVLNEVMIITKHMIYCACCKGEQINIQKWLSKIRDRMMIELFEAKKQFRTVKCILRWSPIEHLL